METSARHFRIQSRMPAAFGAGLLMTTMQSWMTVLCKGLCRLRCLPPNRKAGQKEHWDQNITSHVHSADPDGPVEETSGLGDLLVIDLFLPKRAEWGTWGIGPIAIFPTASDDRLGQGKWQLGPAAVVLYSGIKNWQFGGLVQNPISIAGDSDRNAVSTLLVQPIATRHFKDGWYAGWGEIPFSYEWLNGDYNIPLNMRLGRVTKLGNAPVNMFIEPFYTPSSFQREGQSEWGIKFNLTFLFPKK